MNFGEVLLNLLDYCCVGVCLLVVGQAMHPSSNIYLVNALEAHPGVVVGNRIVLSVTESSRKRVLRR